MIRDCKHLIKLQLIHMEQIYLKYVQVKCLKYAKQSDIENAFKICESKMGKQNAKVCESEKFKVNINDQY